MRPVPACSSSVKTHRPGSPVARGRTRGPGSGTAGGPGTRISDRRRRLVHSGDVLPCDPRIACENQTFGGLVSAQHRTPRGRSLIRCRLTTTTSKSFWPAVESPPRPGPRPFVAHNQPSLWVKRHHVPPARLSRCAADIFVAWWGDQPAVQRSAQCGRTSPKWGTSGPRTRCPRSGCPADLRARRRTGRPRGW